MKLTNDCHAGHDWRLLLLAPSTADVPKSFLYRLTDPELHRTQLSAMQRMRGLIYLQDGAIEAWELTSDGRHKLAVDDSSWHLLGLDPQGEICGCARYLSHNNDVPFLQLGVSRSALAQSEEWGGRLREAVECDLALARARGVAYVEVGGWALSENVRNSLAALQLALASYALARNLGGCIGIGSVTQRHGSASIIRRIGGSPLSVEGVEMPTYFDPRYKCQMEILRFDSSVPNPRYAPWVEGLRSELLAVPVIGRSGTWTEDESTPIHEEAGLAAQGEVTRRKVAGLV